MSGGTQINLICCAQVIANEIAQGLRQKDIALTYAMAMKSHAQGAEEVDWGAINEAILAKWSISGLDRIKKRAWKLLEGKP